MFSLVLVWFGLVSFCFFQVSLKCAEMVPKVKIGEKLPASQFNLFDLLNMQLWLSQVDR